MMLSEAVFQIPKVMFTRGVFRFFFLHRNSVRCSVYGKALQIDFKKHEIFCSDIRHFSAEQKTEHSPQSHSLRRTKWPKLHPPKKTMQNGIMQMPIGINCQPHLLFAFVVACGVCFVCMAVCGGPVAAAAGCCPVPTHQGTPWPLGGMGSPLHLWILVIGPLNALQVKIRAVSARNASKWSWSASGEEGVDDCAKDKAVQKWICLHGLMIRKTSSKQENSKDQHEERKFPLCPLCDHAESNL